MRHYRNKPLLCHGILKCFAGKLLERFAELPDGPILILIEIVGWGKQNRINASDCIPMKLSGQVYANQTLPARVRL